MDALADSLAASLGAPAEQIKLIVLLVLSVPLSLVFPYLPSSTTSILPDVYALVPSFWFLWSVLKLRSTTVQLVINSVVCWAIVKFGGKSKWMPWAVFGVAMGHLAVNNVLAYLDPEASGDATQMVLVIKLTSLAWSAYDGRRSDNELDPTQRRSKITQTPSLLTFLAYTFFFPSILAGPAFTFASYQAFTSRSLFQKEVEAKASGPTAGHAVPPGRKTKALKRLATGLFFLGIYSVYGWQFGYHQLLEPAFVARNSLPRRIGFMNVAGFVARTKYYGVWCIAEAALILSGLGYNPQTGKYDAARNVRIRNIEFAPNFKILLDSWNMNTNVWLRECIYKRVAKKGKKPGFKSTQITFITSALWHGVNPCYLMTFVLGGFAQSLGRSLRGLLRPLFLPPNALTPAPASGTSTPTPLSAALSAAAAAQAGQDVSVPALAPHKPTPAPKLPAPPQTPLKTAYDLAGIVATQLVLNFAVAPFMLLNVRHSVQAWRAVGWYGLAMIFGAMGLLRVGLAGRLKAMRKGRDARAERREGEAKERVEREAYEAQEEGKRRKRGEGWPALGVDLEKEESDHDKLKQE